MSYKRKFGQARLLFILFEGNVGMFDNSYFDNYFGVVQQFKNGLF